MNSAIWPKIFGVIDIERTRVSYLFCKFTTATTPIGIATTPPGTATTPPGTATNPPGTATNPLGTATTSVGTVTGFFLVNTSCVLRYIMIPEGLMGRPKKPEPVLPKHSLAPVSGVLTFRPKQKLRPRYHQTRGNLVMVQAL